MKPKRRVFTEVTLKDNIDRLNALMWERKMRAESLDEKATELYTKWPQGCGTLRYADDQEVCFKEMEKARENREKAARLRRMEPATMRRLKHLKEKLAEIQTQILPGIVPDSSIQL
jgi:hypothetical protein